MPILSLERGIVNTLNKTYTTLFPETEEKFTEIFLRGGGICRGKYEEGRKVLGLPELGQVCRALGASLIVICTDVQRIEAVTSAGQSIDYRWRQQTKPLALWRLDWNSSKHRYGREYHSHYCCH